MVLQWERGKLPGLNFSDRKLFLPLLLKDPSEHMSTAFFPSPRSLGYSGGDLSHGPSLNATMGSSEFVYLILDISLAPHPSPGSLPFPSIPGQQGLCHGNANSGQFHPIAVLRG